jgi:membrane-associated protease RseP (regulator of RpoE activity)
MKGVSIMNKLGMMFSVVILLMAGFIFSYADDEETVFVPHPKGPLGILVTDVDAEKLASLGLKGGAEIEEVFENSEAAEKGLKEEDIITALDDENVDSPEDLVEKIREINEEQDVELTYYRDGSQKKVMVHIKPVKGDFHFRFDDEDFTFHLPDLPENLSAIIAQHPGIFDNKGGLMGIEVKNLSDQLLDYFEVDHGVLVEKVSKDSPAEKAGIKAGDVILSINKRKIEDFSDLVRTLNYYNPGEKVSVEISRKGKKNTLDVILGEKKGDKWLQRKMKAIGPVRKMALPAGTGMQVPGMRRQIKIIKDGGNGDKTVLRLLSI